ncbi:hypothetical protein VTO42DRAFT_2743 [Malbranchea cinnamomea]
MSETADTAPLTVNEAASGILGSISLACWIFLLVPQLVENYRRGSAEAVSLAFIAVWFVGDVANLVGSVWAHLVPVVIAIAVYFCIADGVLISQCIYYNLRNSREDALGTGPSWRGEAEEDVPDPATPLLSRRLSENLGIGTGGYGTSTLRRISSHRSHRSRHRVQDALAKILDETEPRNVWIKNTFSVLAICAVGAAGWAIAWQTGAWKPTPANGPVDRGEIAVGAQVVGYFSALCYLGARIPQIIKNYCEKSCEGLSLLFFILSLLGNLTYGAGILLHSTGKEYVLTNVPWLIGSLGTMVEDIVIFIQFRIYAVREEDTSSAVV